MEICYYISGKSKNGDFADKEFYVYANDIDNAKERLESCLNLHKTVEKWSISKQKVIDRSIDLEEKNEHMRGVWYEPF